MFVDGLTQYLENSTDCAGIFRDQVIGSLFMNQNLKGEIYRYILGNAFIPQITEAIGNQLHRYGNFLLEAAVIFNKMEVSLHYFFQSGNG